MWLSYKDAFVSVVVSRRNPKEYEARTRNLADAKAVSHLLDVPYIATPRGDYAYRLILSKKKLKQLMLGAAETVDYRNYKATMPSGSKRARAHHDAWWAFLILQDEKQGKKGLFPFSDEKEDYIFDEERAEPYGQRNFFEREADVGPPGPGRLSIFDKARGKWVKP